WDPSEAEDSRHTKAQVQVDAIRRDAVNTWLLFRATDAPQVRVGADEDVASGNGQRGVGVLAQPVTADLLEFGLGREDVRVALLICSIKLAINEDQTSPERGAQTPAVPPVFARLQL